MSGALLLSLEARCLDRCFIRRSRSMPLITHQPTRQSNFLRLTQSFGHIMQPVLCCLRCRFRELEWHIRTRRALLFDGRAYELRPDAANSRRCRTVLLTYPSMCMATKPEFMCSSRHCNLSSASSPTGESCAPAVIQARKSNGVPESCRR